MRALADAILFSAHAHRNQRRKDASQTPYINHPLAVMHLLMVEAYIEDEVVLQAAVLHDVIEDTAVTKEELAGLFGQLVADTVDGCSDDKTLPKEVRKRLQVEQSRFAPYRVKLVKLADKTCNIRDMADGNIPQGWPVSRLIAYGWWAKAVVDTLRGTHAKLEALFDEAYHRLMAPLASVESKLQQIKAGTLSAEYSEALIGNTADVEGIEAHGVALQYPLSYQASSMTESPVSDFYVVSVLRRNGGSHVCGEFTTAEEALSFAKVLSERYRWHIFDYTSISKIATV